MCGCVGCTDYYYCFKKTELIKTWHYRCNETINGLKISHAIRKLIEPTSPDFIGVKAGSGLWAYVSLDILPSIAAKMAEKSGFTLLWIDWEWSYLLEHREECRRKGCDNCDLYPVFLMIGEMTDNQAREIISEKLPQFKDIGCAYTEAGVWGGVLGGSSSK